MATQVIHKMIDDLDGSEANETVRFALDTVHYEIDLNDKNAAELRAILAPYIAAGTKVTARIGSRTAGVGFRAERQRNQQIRAWAARNNITVKARGRIPGDVIEKWQADSMREINRLAA